MSPQPNIPDYVRHTLWSYDIDTLDLQRDKRDIITQVLNRGTAKAIHWLRTTYTDAIIAEVVKNPARGRWFPQVLNFWAWLLHINIPRDVYRRALFSLRVPL